jgi:hypothetical protein
MISGKDVYKIWAPDDSVWASWVSPSLFAQIQCAESPSSDYANIPSLHWTASATSPRPAVVVDLPGGESLRFGIALAKLGFRPVLLNNASPGPNPAGIFIGSSSVTTYNILTLTAEICAATGFVRGLNLPPYAPPAFLLDSRRLDGDREPRPEIFDNRWMVFPQDFPTAGFLNKQGIQSVILVQEKISQPHDDLAEVLLKWQSSGIAIFAKETMSRELPQMITVRRSSIFRRIILGLLAALGLRQSSVGGFGSTIDNFTRAG